MGVQVVHVIAHDTAVALSDLRALGIRRSNVEAAARNPRSGTRLRQVYDHLTASPGRWVARPWMASHHHLRQLREVYGLKVMTRKVSASGYQWRLIAAHIGNYYHDYLRGTVTHQRDL